MNNKKSGRLCKEIFNAYCDILNGKNYKCYTLDRLKYNLFI